MTNPFPNEIVISSHIEDVKCNVCDILCLLADHGGTDIYIKGCKKAVSSHSLKNCLELIESIKTETADCEIIKVSDKYAFNFKMIKGVNRADHKVVFRDGQEIKIPENLTKIVHKIFLEGKCTL
jgi:hypothetical protein